MKMPSSTFVAPESRSINVLRKPVTLTAWQYQGESTLENAPEWVREYTIKPTPPLLDRSCKVTVSPAVGTEPYPALFVPEDGATTRANAGDWLVLEPNGRISVCAGSVFNRVFYCSENSSAEASLRIPVYHKNSHDMTEHDHIHNRNITFEGIDLTKVTREMRHGIVDRRTLLLEVARLKAMLADVAEEAQVLHRDLEQSQAQLYRFKKALAFWVSEETSDADELVAMRNSHARLILNSENLLDDSRDSSARRLEANPSMKPTAHEQTAVNPTIGSAGNMMEMSFETIGSMMKEAAKYLRVPSAEAARKQARIEVLEAICAASYQMAGVYDAPTRFLDALALHDEYMALTPDEIIDKLLPVDLPDDTSSSAALAEQQNSQTPGVSDDDDDDDDDDDRSDRIEFE